MIEFLHTMGFYHVEVGNIIMIIAGLIFIYLGITKNYEPLLLVPIGFGILIGNIPFEEGAALGVYDSGSVMNYLYMGVTKGIYPPLIFLGIGAMTDFSALISNPKLMLLGAAAQMGVFVTFLGAVFIGEHLTFLNMSFTLKEAGAVGIIGGADGPTAIFLSSKLAPDLIGAIAIAAYSYMALVPIIQPPVMRFLTSKEERTIRMPAPRKVSKKEKILFPIFAFLIITFIAPDTIPLVGMLLFGNLLRESGVTDRLAVTAKNALIDSITIVLGLTVGASTQASTFLTPKSIGIFILGAFSFVIATASGVLFAKFMNLFLKNKINPLLGAAGVSAVPNAARVVHNTALEDDPENFILMHAMAPNVSGVIGSAIAAGILLSILL